MNKFIGDNILASLVDGVLTPLERMAFREQYNDLQTEEILEITQDVNLMKSHIEKIRPVRFSECERYINEIRKHELPDNLGETKPKTFF